MQMCEKLIGALKDDLSLYSADQQVQPLLKEESFSVYWNTMVYPLIREMQLQKDKDIANMLGAKSD